MVYALGLGEQLVGVSHECDFPAEAKTKPAVSRPALALDGLSLDEIDGAISARLREGESLYLIDEKLLRELKPSLIITQDLCQVCAPSGNELSIALQALETKPEVLFMSPHSLAKIEQNILDLGAATVRENQAHTCVAAMRERLSAIRGRLHSATSRPRVFCIEWVNPMFCSGHWVPEMVELAGGIDALGRKGADSVRITWDAVLNWSPEIVIVSPCGFHLEKSLEQVALLQSLPGWKQLPAVRSERVYAVDADAYFARPGPRVIEGIELLAHLIHPELFDWTGPQEAFAKPFAQARR